jgi:hypothetical protein
MTRQLFTDLGDRLLAYKKANPVDRQAMLLAEMRKLQDMPFKAISKEMSKEVTGNEVAMAAYKQTAMHAYLELSYTATLIRYAEVLSNVENQRPFEILFDFANMEFKGEFASLADTFELNAKTSEMRLKCPVDEIKIDTWKLFRKAQVAHLNAADVKKREAKANEAARKAREAGEPDEQIRSARDNAYQNAFAHEKPKMDIFNFAKLDLDNPNLKLPEDVLDPENPPEDQLLPVQIQALGKLRNEAVDRTCVDAKGQYRLTRRPDGMMQLPGGGMVEILTDTKKVDAYQKKMLDEYLEEERANLHRVAAEMYDELAPEAFNRVFEEVLKHESARVIDDATMNFITKASEAAGSNSAKIQTVVQAVDGLIHSAKQELADVEQKLLAEKVLIGTLFSNSFDSKNQANLSNYEKLESRKKELLGEHKKLYTFRALVQTMPFELTPLYKDAQRYIKENAEEVLIQEYCDVRGLGGSNTSHSFIFKGKPLEDWFTEKFDNVPGEFGDDLTGNAAVRMTLMGALGQFKKLRFSHILNMLANQLEVMNNGSLPLEKTWNVKEYEDAVSYIKAQANDLFELNAKNKNVQEIWASAEESLNKAINGLSKSKKDKINEAVAELKAKLSNKKSDAEEIKKAYAEFQAKCNKILDKKDAVALNAILTTLAIVVTMVLVALIGFGIGFVAGLWTGPGAFFAGVAAGSAAACSVVAATGAAGILTGALVGHGLFKKKPEVPEEKQAVSDFTKDASHIVSVLPEEVPQPQLSN